MHAGPARFRKVCRIASEKPIAGSDVWKMAMLWSGVVTRKQGNRTEASVGEELAALAGRPDTIRGSGSGDHRTGRPSDVRTERLLADESGIPWGNFVRI